MFVLFLLKVNLCCILFSTIYQQSITQVFSGGSEDIRQLRALGITHVLNMAHGRRRRSWSARHVTYKQLHITYHGITAIDSADYDIRQHFDEAIQFIEQARQEGKRSWLFVLVGHKSMYM